jgi:hypothetical protein
MGCGDSCRDRGGCTRREARENAVAAGWKFIGRCAYSPKFYAVSEKGPCGPQGQLYRRSSTRSGRCKRARRDDETNRERRCVLRRDADRLLWDGGGVREGSGARVRRVVRLVLRSAAAVGVPADRERSQTCLGPISTATTVVSTTTGRVNETRRRSARCCCRRGVVRAGLGRSDPRR